MLVREMVERYGADVAVLSRAYPVEASPARLDRFDALHAAWRSELDAVDVDALGPDERVDWVLLSNLVERQTHASARRRAEIERIRPLVPGMDAVLALEGAHRAHCRPDPAVVAADLTAAADAVEALLEGGEGGERAAASPDPATAHLAAEAVGEFAHTLEAWFAFYDGYDPEATWWLREPCARLGRALTAYAEALAGAAVREAEIAGTPIGEAAVRAELQDAMIAYAPDELVAIARRELDWCRREMVRAAGEMGLGDDWQAALERVKETCVAPGGQPGVIYGLAAGARRFVDEHDLVTVPPLADETWRAQMMSPERQKVNPFFLGGEVIRISYPTDTMSYAERRMSMRGNNPYFSRSTVFHELIPGHYLQQFMGARHRPHRRLFHNPYWLEGNAFYWEMVLWDLDFARTPEERLGMLFWRAHRSARVIYTLGFHLGQMSTDACVDLLVSEVGHEPDNAKGEVRRLFAGHYGPLYQCAYMVGAFQFYALRRELVVSGRMTHRAFHDAVLEQNQMPVELLRAILMGQPIGRGFRASWRFMDATARGSGQ